MLSKLLSKGVELRGLGSCMPSVSMSNNGAVVQDIGVEAAYRYRKNQFSAGGTIDFFLNPTMRTQQDQMARDRLTTASDERGSRVKLLPWLTGGVSTVKIQGLEVLSGPFSGCTMGIYTDAAGVAYASHVSRESGVPEPVDAWTATKGTSNGVHEHETKGQKFSFLGATDNMNSQGVTAYEIYVVADVATNTFTQIFTKKIGADACVIVRKGTIK